MDDRYVDAFTIYRAYTSRLSRVYDVKNIGAYFVTVHC